MSQQMENNVLLAFASKYGATVEIATRIGLRLSEVGLEVDVRPAERVEDLGAYRAVVLGSAVYLGQWRREAADFMEIHEIALRERMVWLFSSGPTGEGDPVELTNGWRFPEALEPLAGRIRPIDIACFGGKLDVTNLNFAEKLIVKRVKAPMGDFRDWASIDGWTGSIAASLLASGEAPLPAGSRIDARA